MYKIFVDLEMHPIARAFTKEFATLKNEIIEIGAVMLDEHLREIASFKEYVHPDYSNKVYAKYQKLTSITTEMLADAPCFQSVFARFCKWCGNDYIIYSWSDNDIFTLEDNMLYHEMEIDDLPACYDIQPMFDDQISQNDRNMALSYAVWKLDIKVSSGHLHDALCDAKETAEVMKRLDLSEGLEDYIIE